MGHYKRLLVVDDDEIFVIGLKMILSRVEFCDEVIVYHSPEEAISELSTWVNNPDLWPDIAFIDINMPVLNGWEFLEEISKTPVLSRSKVFIVSSSIDEDDNDKAIQNELVIKKMNKPILPDVLKELMSR